MITIRYDRKKGESTIVDAYPAKGDEPFEAAAKIIAEVAIKHRFVKTDNEK